MQLRVKLQLSSTESVRTFPTDNFNIYLHIRKQFNFIAIH